MAFVTATVTQSVSMSGASFSSVSTTVTGTTSSVVEQTLASVGSGGTGTGGAAVDCGVLYTAGDLQLLYLLSDAADMDVIFTGTGGTPHTEVLKAGVAKIYNIGGGTADPTASATGTVEMTLRNNGSQAVNTDFHARMIYSS